MAADHEKEEDEGWTHGLMQGFQAAGQKYRSIKLMLNLSSASFSASVQNIRTMNNIIIHVRTQVTHFRHPTDEQSRLLDFLSF